MALQQSAAVLDSVPEVRYLTLGGGNQNGAFTQSALQAITAAIEAGQFAAYAGVAYDVEEGDSGLGAAFAASFAAAKAQGLKVLVTVSYSEPYGISDAASLMQGFFADDNIDYLSPQLYTSGTETQNDYTAVGVSWEKYTTTKASVTPSIVQADMYADAQNYFAQQGVTLGGFVQWSQG